MTTLRTLQDDPRTPPANPAAGAPRSGQFMMATGLECSYPTVQGGKRRDELELTRHYEFWRRDFELCAELGARYVRYGLPYYRMHLGPGRYDWSFSDEVLPAMWDAGLVPILDLCHFGVPDWIGGFQNGDWPYHFADYAECCAARYPWIRLYTPVNEIQVCAAFSALFGAWNEQHRSHESYVVAHLNMCRAALLAIERIRQRRGDALFIQSEAAEITLERYPSTRVEVDLRNQLRFLTFDFLHGRPLASTARDYLFDNGLDRADYDWLLAHGREAASSCVLGMDYYEHNEKVLDEKGQPGVEGDFLGWAAVAGDYYRRYRRPLMLTETNMNDDGAGKSVRWLQRTWHQSQHIRQLGVPLVGYTWYSLTDQVDWKVQLSEIRNEVDPNGLVTLDREMRDVGREFGALAKTYGAMDMLPNLPLALFQS